SDASALAGTRARVKEIESQLSAFASEEIKARLEAHRKRQAEGEFLKSQNRELLEWLAKLEGALGTAAVGAQRLPMGIDPSFVAEFAALLAALRDIEDSTRAAVLERIAEGKRRLGQWEETSRGGPWYRSVV